MTTRATRDETNQARLNRRQFAAGAAAITFSVVGAKAVAQQATPPKVKLGLIGCGGRGTWIARLFQQHGGYEITAGTDYFADRVNSFGDALQVPAAQRYTGLAGYKRLLEKADVDAVAIESPPYFHPEQAAAAVDAGKHVYVAKPIAVDVPGCHTIGDSGKKATERDAASWSISRRGPIRSIGRP